MDSQEEHPTNNLSRDINAPRISKDYFTKVFVEIEGRVNEKISDEPRVGYWVH